MGYEHAISTKLLATHCVCCGKELRDPESVERGMGPECSKEGYLEDGPAKDEVNKLIHHAAIAATSGNIAYVLEAAARIKELGYEGVSEKVSHRFVNAVRNVKLRVTMVGDTFHVETPFRRGDKEAFIAAWRAIPGRRYSNGKNVIPVSSKRALWNLLGEFFPGVYGEGDKGLFRIPTKA